MDIYTGYVYLWYDTKAKLFYLGGHKGKVKDSYICSNKMMLRAYKKRPETFRFKVLEYVNGDNSVLREAEQRWLNMIKDEELYWTPNIYNKTVKYYNKKKCSSGGNGSANKGKSHPAWNKGLKLDKPAWNKGLKGYQVGWNKGQKGIKPHSEETKLIMSQKKTEYWENCGRKRPLKIFYCPVCKSKIETRNQNKKTCSQSCRNLLRYNGDVYLTEYTTETPNDLD